MHSEFDFDVGKHSKNKCNTFEMVDVSMWSGTSTEREEKNQKQTASPEIFIE